MLGYCFVQASVLQPPVSWEVKVVFKNAKSSYLQWMVVQVLCVVVVVVAAMAVAVVLLVVVAVAAVVFIRYLYVIAFCLKDYARLSCVRSRERVRARERERLPKPSRQSRGRGCPQVSVPEVQIRMSHFVLRLVVTVCLSSKVVI